MDKFFAAIGFSLVVFPVVFLLSLLGMLYRSWAVSVLWGWFVTPLCGVQPPGVWMLAGLMLVYYVFVNHHEDDGVQTGRGREWRPLVTACFTPISCVFIGWIIKTWLLAS